MKEDGAFMLSLVVYAIYFSIPSGVRMDDDIKSKIGQPIKQMINRRTGEVIELDGTYYLDTVWSEKLGSYILDVKQK